MLYGKVENGEIKSVSSKPKFVEIDGYRKGITDETLLQAGYYPIVEDTQTIVEGWQYISGSTYEFVDGQVFEKKTVVDRDLEELREEKKQQIVQMYEQKLAEGFTSTGGLKLDIKANNLVDWIGLAMKIQATNPTHIFLKDYNNIVQEVHSYAFLTAFNEGSEYIQNLMMNLWDFKSELKDMTTHSEIYSYNPTF